MVPEWIKDLFCEKMWHSPTRDKIAHGGLAAHKHCRWCGAHSREESFRLEHTKRRSNGR